MDATTHARPSVDCAQAFSSLSSQQPMLLSLSFRYVASGDMDGAIFLWSPKSDKPVGQCSGHSKWITSLVGGTTINGFIWWVAPQSMASSGLWHHDQWLQCHKVSRGWQHFFARLARVNAHEVALFELGWIQAQVACTLGLKTPYKHLGRLASCVLQSWR
eukprot:1150287-Pelagomonas_calceolata.AAC.6